MLKYKDYYGKVELDEEAKIFYGEVLGLNDVITFQGKSSEEVIKAFHDSIDDYLEFCKEEGVSPEKPFSGKLVVRMPSDMHKRLSLKANLEGVSLNSLILRKLKHSSNTSDPKRKIKVKK